MAVRLLPLNFRVQKDDGDPAADGSITFYLAGISTLASVSSTSALADAGTGDLGSSIDIDSDGYPESEDVWGDSAISYKVTIAATGFNNGAPKTFDYLTLATDTEAEDTDSVLAFKNTVVNGAFVCWTGGTSFSNVSGDDTGDEVADGWYVAQPSSAANSVSRQTAETTTARYGLRVQRPNGSGSTDAIRLYATLSPDEAARLRGKIVTLSFTVKAGADYSPTSDYLGVKLATGTTASEDGGSIEAGSWAGQSNAISLSQAIPTTATRYEFSTTLGSGIANVGVQFKMTPTGSASTNDWFQIEDVQLEVASSATDFEAQPEKVEYLRAKLSPGGRLFVASGFTDPGADRVMIWDDSAGDVVGAALGTGLAVSGTTLQPANDLAAVEGISGTGLAARTASETWTARAVAAGTGIGVADGDGVAGNPTVSLSHLGLQTLTDPGADRLAFWDDSETAFGWLSLGTGLSISTTTISLDAQLVDVAGLTPTDGNFIVGDGANFVAESGATAVASLGASNILTALLAVDGSGSGLDADKVDGVEASAIAQLAGTAAFTAQQKINLNAAVPPTPITGAVAQLTGADDATPGLEINAFGTQSGQVILRKARTSGAAPSAAQVGDGLGGVQWRGYGATGFSSAARAAFSAIAVENWTDTAQGAYVKLFATPAGGTSIAEKFRFGDNTSQLELGYAFGGAGVSFTDNDTLEIADFGKFCELNAGTAKALTIPPNSSVAFPIYNTAFAVDNIGAGAWTLTPGSGVTLLDEAGTSGAIVLDQYDGGVFYKRATNTWVYRGTHA